MSGGVMSSACTIGAMSRSPRSMDADKSAERIRLCFIFRSSFICFGSKLSMLSLKQAAMEEQAIFPAVFLKIFLPHSLPPPRFVHIAQKH